MLFEVFLLLSATDLVLLIIHLIQQQLRLGRIELENVLIREKVDTLILKQVYGDHTQQYQS